MLNSTKTWLFDVKNAIEEIALFLDEKDYSFDHYTNDLKTRKAVERNLTIIGEAMNRALMAEENLPITNARKIVDTRNRMVHGYAQISNEIIWDIIQFSLPVLHAEVSKLLND